MVLFGGHAWFYLGGACVVLFGGHAWFYSLVLFMHPNSGGGVRGFIRGGMRGFIRGACLSWAGGHEHCVVLFGGGVRGFTKKKRAVALTTIESVQIVKNNLG